MNKLEKKGKKNERNQTWDTLKILLAGGLSGSCAKTITAPLDRVKLLLQNRHPNYHQFIGKPLGLFQAVFHIHKTHGLFGLFQGHGAMLLRIFPSASIRFTSYEAFQKLLIPTSDLNSPWRHFLAGSLAGNTAVLFTYPLEVIRSQLAFHIHQNPIQKFQFFQKHYSIWNTCQSIYKHHGISGFYRGFGATMLGIIPYAGAAFSSYQFMKEKLIELNKDEKLNFFQHLLIGGLAGMMGQTVAYPFDTIRHRMQLNWDGQSIGSVLGERHHLHTNSTSATSKPVTSATQKVLKRLSTFASLKMIIQKEGWRSLFNGVSVNYWKTVPANAIAFVTYDYLKKLLNIDTAPSSKY